MKARDGDGKDGEVDAKGHKGKANGDIRVIKRDVSEEKSQTGTVSRAVAPMLDSYYESLVDFLGDDEPNEDDENRQWLVKGIIAADSPTLLVGAPKSGKSLVAMHLAITLASGAHDWLGFPVNPCRVLFLAHEDPKIETRRRIWRVARGMGIDPRALDGWLIVRDRQPPFRFDNAEDVARLERTVRPYQVGAIIVDSLTRAHSKDENEASEMKSVTEIWMDLGARLGVACVVIHHANKAIGGGVRGSGEILAGARHKVQFSLLKEHTETGGRCIRLSTDGNLAFQPEPFALAIEDAEDDGKKAITLGRASAEQVAQAEVEQADADAEVGQDIERAILDALALKPVYARELARAIHVRNKKVGEVLDQLKGKGLVHRPTSRHPWALVAVRP